MNNEELTIFKIRHKDSTFHLSSQKKEEKTASSNGGSTQDPLRGLQ